MASATIRQTNREPVRKKRSQSANRSLGKQSMRGESANPAATHFQTLTIWPTPTWESDCQADQNDVICRLCSRSGVQQDPEPLQFSRCDSRFILIG